MLASYDRFLAIADAGRWDEAAIDLGADAEGWRRLASEERAWLGGVIAGFDLGEDALATALEGFEASVAGTPVAACFAAQRRDEARHARFFSRLRHEVVGADKVDPNPVFVELFEHRLPTIAERLAAGEVAMGEAAGLCHMLLEGCVFGAGQSALLAWLEARPGLPGTRRGVELVARDERWHLGFGARLLQDAEIGDELAAALVAESAEVLAVWRGVLDAEMLAGVERAHRRRLRAAGLLDRGA